MNMKVWPVISECDAAAVAAFGLDAAEQHVIYRKAAAAILAQPRVFAGDAKLAKDYLIFANRFAAKAREYADSLISYRNWKGEA